MEKNIFTSFTVPDKNNEIPINKVRCNDCSALVDATFIEMSTHQQIEDANSSNAKITSIVADFPPKK